ncbi:MAG: aspartate dehydrogenase domain-containing protein [Gammaproteobacteria bacterium]
MNDGHSRAPMQVALGGYGNVARQLVRAIETRPELNLAIAAVSARDLGAARARASESGLDVPVVSAAQLPEHSRIIVECATYAGFRPVVEPAVRAGAHVVCVSVGALGVNMDLLDLAAEHGGTVQIASGAIPGLDIVRSAREGNIESVRLTSHILARSLAHEAYVTERGIDLARAESEPVPIFSGSAREAARHFPRHFNVAVALSLAGIGLDRTQIEILADGRIPGARHTVRVKSDVIELEMTSQNFPSVENNRTSRIVAPSILAALRELNATIRIGS